MIISFSNQMYNQYILCFCTSDFLVYKRNAFKKCGVSLRSIVLWVIFVVVVVMVVVVGGAGFWNCVHY